MIACLSGQVVGKGDRVDKQKAEAKRKNEDERNVPVLLLEDYRQCQLGQSHTS